MSRCQLHIVNNEMHNVSNVVHVLFTDEFYCLRISSIHH